MQNITLSRGSTQYLVGIKSFFYENFVKITSEVLFLAKIHSF